MYLAFWCPILSKIIQEGAFFVHHYIILLSLIENSEIRNSSSNLWRWWAVWVPPSQFSHWPYGRVCVCWPGTGPPSSVSRTDGPCSPCPSCSSPDAASAWLQWPAGLLSTCPALPWSFATPPLHGPFAKRKKPMWTMPVWRLAIHNMYHLHYWSKVWNH